MHLTEIRAEAFEACILLRTVALPRQLRNLTHRGAEADKRRPQVAANAFEGCQALTVMGGICCLSLRGGQHTQKHAHGSLKKRT